MSIEAEFSVNFGHLAPEVAKILEGASSLIELAVVASSDGLLIEGFASHDDLSQTAAVSASILSLADAISSRSGDAQCQKVLSESGESSFLILHAGELVLTVVGEEKANMGLVLNAGKKLASKIALLTEQDG